MDTEMCKELGEFKVDLDGRFSSVRTRETNLGMSSMVYLITVMVSYYYTVSWFTLLKVLHNMVYKRQLFW